jgi:hypothetical protein
LFAILAERACNGAQVAGVLGEQCRDALLQRQIFGAELGGRLRARWRQRADRLRQVLELDPVGGALARARGR